MSHSVPIRFLVRSEGDLVHLRDHSIPPLRSIPSHDGYGCAGVPVFIQVHLVLVPHHAIDSGRGLLRQGRKSFPGTGDLRRDKESFVFLGCTIRKKRSIERKRAAALYSVAGPEGDEEVKFRDPARELTSARSSGKDLKQIIAELNPAPPALRGWENYFRTGTADREGVQQDGRLRILQPAP